MPRSRSWASVSRKASRWSTRPSLRTAPLRYNNPSDRVVLPASTWASKPVQIRRFIRLTSFAGPGLSQPLLEPVFTTSNNCLGGSFPL